MTDPFGIEYARLYDAMYADKDYEGECDALLRAAKSHGLRDGARILDVGCGTGRHAAVMAARGYEVVGTDRSEAMLEIARSRVRKGVNFRSLSQIRSSGIKFDFVVSLFDVLSYLVELEDLVEFVGNLAHWTVPKGLVAFDAWHLPGLWADPPTQRSGRYELRDGSVVSRTSTPAFDRLNGVTNVRYEVKVDSTSDRLEFLEHHEMRAFTRLELQMLAYQAGLTLLEIRPTLGGPAQLTSDSWHIAVLTRKN